jgi:hypothetical protein
MGEKLGKQNWLYIVAWKQKENAEFRTSHFMRASQNIGTRMPQFSTWLRRSFIQTTPCFTKKR